MKSLSFLYYHWNYKLPSFVHIAVKEEEQVLINVLLFLHQESIKPSTPFMRLG
jgi:hypothetical protein